MMIFMICEKECSLGIFITQMNIYNMQSPIFVPLKKQMKIFFPQTAQEIKFFSALSFLIIIFFIFEELNIFMVF
jgi:hypothetical protein